MDTHVRQIILAATLAGCIAGWAGCETYGFEQSYEVTDLRVLAIRLEPPELAPGTTVVADALAVDPRASEPFAYTWEVCAFDTGPDGAFACATDDEGNVLGATVSTDPTATLPYDLMVAATGTADALCAALAEADVPDFVELPACDRGFPLTVRLTVVTGSGESREEEIAVKRLLLLRDGVEPNANPSFGPLDIDGAASPDGSTVDVSESADPIALELAVDAATAEVFEDTSAQAGETATRTEQLSLSWYATAGRIEHPATYFDEGRAPIEELRTNELTVDWPADVPAGEDVTLWLVLRDDRGGTAFSTHTLRRAP